MLFVGNLSGGSAQDTRQPSNKIQGPEFASLDVPYVEGIDCLYPYDDEGASSSQIFGEKLSLSASHSSKDVGARTSLHMLVPINSFAIGHNGSHNRRRLDKIRFWSASLFPSCIPSCSRNAKETRMLNNEIGHLLKFFD